ncbi:UNVERIFIED_ORG: hypothetical protein M2435_001301 [Rhizobium sophorae]|uniref:hypothetical protein n=1 Tax=Rhizobium leguminosarum TaxID=384 RepID=UPI00185599B6|nr:hypothetical protein [Rhizobium leguminosarum]MBB4520521.1 hypothetical protein [Rhizobium leguminosarum]MDH6658402.1 hypothetical protein [Rhizobium sophorae]
MMDAKQLHILQHSLGIDQYGRGRMYRDHFVTGEGSDDHADCMALTAPGYLTRRANVPMYGGSDLFRVTDAGKRAVVEASPAPPKISAAKQRYLDYLDADSSMPFGQWLKWKSKQSAEARIYG